MSSGFHRAITLAGLLSMLGLAALPAFADKPDVTIKFDDNSGTITEVKPQVKGLCFSPDPKKGDCDDHVTWRVTDGMGSYKIQIAPRKGEPDCFPNTAFPLVIDKKGPNGEKTSGAADGNACPAGTTWKYELQVVKPDGTYGDKVDPFVVFDQ